MGEGRILQRYRSSWQYAGDKEEGDVPVRGSDYCAAGARRRSDRLGDEHRPSRRRDSAEESAGWFAAAPGALRSIPLQADVPVANVLAGRRSRPASILGAVAEFSGREFCGDE